MVRRLIKRQFTSIKTTINDNSKIDFVWVGRATRRWQPKTKEFKAGDPPFFMREYWFNTQKMHFSSKKVHFLLHPDKF
jgi:hypothetical protein